MPTCPQCQVAYPAEIVVCPDDGAQLVVGLTTLSGGDTLPSGRTRLEDSDDAPDPLVGATLMERFTLSRRLGKGGMGSVYAAQHKVIGKLVAVKVLHEKFVDRPELAGRLKMEAKLASSIEHQHIIDIYDFGETGDGRTFVVMEFLDGESLAQRLRRDGPLPELKLVDLVLQITSALGAAHAKGIIHRDVKPENVFLIQRDGHDFVKVVDFGISRIIREHAGGDSYNSTTGPRLTETGMVLGTPLYMSPEQARGEDDLDLRIDVYALGVMMYECLTAEVPFRGSNYLGIISQVISHDPAPPREVRPDLGISESMERVVLRAMSKERGARYASMAELATDLDRVRAGAEVEAPLPPVGGGAPRRRSTTGVFAGISAVIIAAAAGTALVVNYAPRAAPPPVVVVAAPPPPALPPLPPAPSKTVTVTIKSDPPGADVFDGARIIGTTPGTVELDRSERAVDLTFHLDGHDDAHTSFIPNRPNSIEMRLQAAKKVVAKRHPPSSTKATSTRDKTAKVTAASETAPNPYPPKPDRR